MEPVVLTGPSALTVLPGDDEIVAFVRQHGSGVTTGFVAFRYGLAHQDMRALLRRLRDEGRLIRGTAKVRDQGNHSWRFIAEWTAAKLPEGPRRIQRLRTKGWTMPPNTIYVGRPSTWGNPFLVDANYMPWLAVGMGYRADGPGRHHAAVALYRAWLSGTPAPVRPLPDSGDVIEFSNGRQLSTSAHAQGLALQIAGLFAPGELQLPPRPDVAVLRGKNLACYCRLDEPCHADVLLELANR